MFCNVRQAAAHGRMRMCPLVRPVDGDDTFEHIIVRPRERPFVALPTASSSGYCSRPGDVRESLNLDSMWYNFSGDVDLGEEQSTELLDTAYRAESDKSHVLTLVCDPRPSEHPTASSVTFRCAAHITPPRPLSTGSVQTAANFTTTIVFLPCLRLENMLPVSMQFQVCNIRARVRVCRYETARWFC
jgi:hypothetical protein